MKNHLKTISGIIMILLLLYFFGYRPIKSRAKKELCVFKINTQSYVITQDEDFNDKLFLHEQNIFKEYSPFNSIKTIHVPYSIKTVKEIDGLPIYYFKYVSNDSIPYYIQKELQEEYDKRIEIANQIKCN